MVTDELAYISILDLPPHPPVAADDVDRNNVFFGVDTLLPSPASYQLSLELISQWLAVGSAQSEMRVPAPGHGLTAALASGVPRPIQMTVTGVVTIATTQSLDTLHTVHAVSAPDNDTLILQHSGMVRVSGGHSLLQGRAYFLRDNGSLSTLPASPIESRVITVWDSERLFLWAPNYHVVPPPVVTFLADISSPDFYYYGFAFGNNTWRIDRYAKATLAKSVATAGYTTLAAAWFYRQLLVYA